MTGAMVFLAHPFRLHEKVLEYVDFIKKDNLLVPEQFYDKKTNNELYRRADLVMGFLDLDSIYDKTKSLGTKNEIFDAWQNNKLLSVHVFTDNANLLTFGENEYVSLFSEWDLEGLDNYVSNAS